jgi:hypothetical protein
MFGNFEPEDEDLSRLSGSFGGDGFSAAMSLM